MQQRIQQHMQSPLHPTPPNTTPRPPPIPLPPPCAAQVIIPAPYWVSYPEMAALAGAAAVIINTTPEQGFLMSAEQLEAALTTQSRVLILCTPSNPTGEQMQPGAQPRCSHRDSA